MNTTKETPMKRKIANVPAWSGSLDIEVDCIAAV